MKRASRPSRASSFTKKRISPNSKEKRGQIRIIGGQWRGRKLSVLNAEGLRPTTDRNKETLFNWLMPYITHATCLDAFAGAGSLGIEALSRYADSCDFIELDSLAANELKKNLTTLISANKPVAQVHHGDALMLLPKLSNKPFDIIFVDPPFNKALVQRTLNTIADNNIIAPNGLIYVEHEAGLASLSLPDNWQIIKQKRTSALNYYLIEVSETSAAR